MFSLVHVCKEMPDHMQHFEADFNAIVNGTHSQMYGGKDIKSYSLYPLRNGKVEGSIAWYYESQLTLCDHQDKAWAEQAIEDHNFDDANS